MYIHNIARVHPQHLTHMYPRHYRAQHTAATVLPALGLQRLCPAHFWAVVDQLQGTVQGTDSAPPGLEEQ